MPTYLFTVEADADGPMADWLIDISAMIGVTHDEFKTSLAVLRRIGEDTEEQERLPNAVNMLINLRSRFAALGGPFRVDTETELLREELDEILRTESGCGQLRKWLDRHKDIGRPQQLHN